MARDNTSSDKQSADSAADLIRQKVDRLYKQEPDVVDEMAESGAAELRSPHQRFAYQLSRSAKDLAAIQTDWHDYYQSLSDKDKFEVWQEFYNSQSKLSQLKQASRAEQAVALSEHKSRSKAKPKVKSKPKRLPDKRSVSEVRQSIKSKVSAGGKLKARHHVQSLLVGLGTGAVVVIIFLFGFFNEVIISPLIQPSRASAQTPLIIGNNAPPPTSSPEVIIPKINVEIPVDYNETSTDESVIENDLNSGVVHYPTTVLPGQTGNTAFFGHSSNNIFNPGKYKFAFVLLHTLVNGDTFYLTYNDKLYAYKVISKSIVDPSDVGVLGPVTGQTATATLITCDPPGTSLHRLIVVGQQISPDPSTNTAATTTQASSGSPTSLPGNGPTLWSRFISTAIGKIMTALIVGGFIIYLTNPLRKKYLSFR